MRQRGLALCQAHVGVAAPLAEAQLYAVSAAAAPGQPDLKISKDDNWVEPPFRGEPGERAGRPELASSPLRSLGERLLHLTDAYLDPSQSRPHLAFVAGTAFGRRQRVYYTTARGFVKTILLYFRQFKIA